MTDNPMQLRFKDKCGCGNTVSVTIKDEDDILSLLEAGWPICPDCGDDLEAVSQKNGCWSPQES